MSDPYLGEIKMWSFNWAPRGWALCDGTTLQASQNQALFALLGYAFGGNGSTTFQLPDLRGRTPIGIGTTPGENTSYMRGNSGGAEGVVLTAATVPPHVHALKAYTSDGTAGPPTGAMMAEIVSTVSTSTTNFSSYLPASAWTAGAPLAPASVSNAGASAPHNNMQPSAVVNFTICTSGTFPMRN